MDNLWFINFDKAVKGYSKENPRLTMAVLGELLLHEAHGIPAGLINRKSCEGAMTGIIYEDGAAILWPQTPHFVMQAFGRFFNKDMRRCLREYGALFDYKRTFPVMLGFYFPLLPVRTALPGGGSGLSYLRRNFFN